MDNWPGRDEEDTNSLPDEYSSGKYFNFVAAFSSTGSLTQIASLRVKLTRSLPDSRSNNNS